MAARNQDSRRDVLDRGRTDSRSGGGLVVAYKLPGGKTREVQGDDEGPWVRNPPFPTQLTSLDRYDPLQDNTLGYVFTPAIDVERYRTLALWLRWETAIVGGSFSLSIVPEGRPIGGGPDTQWPTVAINPTITTRTLVAPFAGFGAVFGSRDFHPAEFRTPAIGGPFSMSTVLPFDVTHLERMRFAVVQLGTDGASILELGYTIAT